MCCKGVGFVVGTAAVAAIAYGLGYFVDHTCGCGEIAGRVTSAAIVCIGILGAAASGKNMDEDYNY
jgi:hypothetical protein